MKTLKLLIKTSFFNEINDFMCFNIVTFSKDSPKTRFTYLLYCNVFFSFASWSILDDVLLLFVVSALGVFQWPCSTVSGSV